MNFLVEDLSSFLPESLGLIPPSDLPASGGRDGNPIVGGVGGRGGTLPASDLPGSIGGGVGGALPPSELPTDVRVRRGDGGPTIGGGKIDGMLPSGCGEEDVSIICGGRTGGGTLPSTDLPASGGGGGEGGGTLLLCSIVSL